MDHPQEVRGKFIIADTDAAELFQPSDQPDLVVNKTRPRQILILVNKVVIPGKQG